jgi:FtsP/CotA-like multicopper oxidase with cupredoxin domain
VQPSDEGGQLAELGDTQRRAAGREDDERIVRLGARPAAGQRSQLPAIVMEEDTIRMPPPVGLDYLKLLPEERMERVRDPHPFPRSGGARRS